MRDRWHGGRPRFDRDERAVSVVVGYVLTLAIGAVLLSGVVIGIGGVVDSQTDRVVRGDLEVTGQTTVANLESADRLARAAVVDRPPGAADSTNVSVGVDLPTRLAGRSYRIAVDDDAVTLRTDDPEITVEIPHAATLPVAETSVRGGPVRIRYVSDDAGGPELEVSER
ncbi:hypothetical protein DJ69_15085 [Halorubrum persicum]|uniref:Uncharacterized protein n=1 Tax=Halorubrum persicum TaxID=1383844 RepID=A0A2G1WFX8_9EURY|nr:hypothetical protein [Halorubrum persicum]PHQ37872.1 hypothetical protein DJ69_15085 [Halorubrum persicum]